MEKCGARIPVHFFDRADDLANETGTSRAAVFREAIHIGLAMLQSELDEALKEGEKNATA